MLIDRQFHNVAEKLKCNLWPTAKRARIAAERRQETRDIDNTHPPANHSKSKCTVAINGS